MVSLMDLTKRRYGDLTVIARTQNALDGHTQWLCRCICGVPHIARSDNLRKGRTTRCPRCVAKKHSIQIEAWFHPAVDELGDPVEAGFAVARKGDEVVVRTKWVEAPRRKTSHSPILTRVVLDLARGGHIRMGDPSYATIRAWVKRNLEHITVHSHIDGHETRAAWRMHGGVDLGQTVVDDRMSR